MSDELEDYKKQLEEITAIMDQMRQLFEERIGSNEVVIGSLMKAFTEISSAIEVIAEKVMEPSSEEEKKAFREEVRRRHYDQLRMMEKIGREVERSDANDPSATVLQMAGEHGTEAKRESDGDSDMQDEDTTGDKPDIRDFI